MNNAFSIKRFLLLLGKHWIEKRKIYLAGLATYMLVIIIIYVLSVIADPRSFDRDYQLGAYYGGLFIGGIIYVGLMFTDYSRKETGIFNLLLPASHLEKAMVYFCYGVLFFWTASTCCFMLIDNTCITFIEHDPPLSRFIPFQRVGSNEVDPYILQLVFLFAQTIFVAGSLYFRRFAFFKTSLVIAIIFGFVVLLTERIEINDGDNHNSAHYHVMSVTSSDVEWGGHNTLYMKNTETIADFSPAVNWMIYGLGALIFLGFCSVIYLRLKEKEI